MNGTWRGAQLAAKRLFDILSSSVLLVILSPLLGFVCLLIRLRRGPPVFFSQQRPGLHGQPFTLIKFRTMTDVRDAEGSLLPDEQRLTRVGRFLRGTSLDELPQLWNVLKGEMSLIGPRPLHVRYLERYTPEQARRHNVKPGITGWAQVNGRNALTWEDRFRLDVYYVDHWSLGLDLRILGLTTLKVLKREGISEPGQATMSEFTGTVSRHDGA